MTRLFVAQAKPIDERVESFTKESDEIHKPLSQLTEPDSSSDYKWIFTLSSFVGFLTSVGFALSAHKDQNCMKEGAMYLLACALLLITAYAATNYSNSNYKLKMFDQANNPPLNNTDDSEDTLKKSWFSFEH